METVFESENIKFVNLSEELISSYMEMVNDTERVGRHIGISGPVSLESEREFVSAALENGKTIFSMITRDGDAFIGNIELDPGKDNTAELGIAVRSSMQDKGYGSEAVKKILSYGFEELRLQRVILNVHKDNPRAIHVYEKLGFKKTGESGNSYKMDIFKKEYKEKHEHKNGGD